MTMGAALNVYCLPDFLLHMRILKFFLKVDSIRHDYQVIPGHGNPQKRRTMFICLYSNIVP